MRCGSSLRWFIVGACFLSACSTDSASSPAAGSGGTGSDAGDGGTSTGASTSGGASSGGVPGAGGANASGATASGGAASMVPRTHLTYVASDAIIRNPERGFYRATSIIDEDTLSWIDDAYSLYFSYVRLDDYRDAALPEALLDDVDAGIQMVRDEGAKLILRFAYNDGPYPDTEPDASLSRVLEHISQLGPVLRENSDVIATLQAGFIGAWGEWHTSTNGLTTPENKKAVLDALLAELPVERTVQVRYPPDLMEFYGDEPMQLADAFSGSSRSRTAHHNDCFLAGDRDTGTYPEPTDPEVFKTYLSQNNLFGPMGGETCAPSPPRSECAVALEEMERLRFSFINDDYHPTVVQSWTAGGCRETMERSLGYRLELLDTDLPETVAPGGEVVVRVKLRNVGFAAPMNERPVRLVLVVDGADWMLDAVETTEVRSWLPETVVAEHEIEFRGRLPELDEGDYELHLWLPDADEDLAADARYSIRLANEGVWDETRGENVLGTLKVASGAPLDSVMGAVDFTLR